MRLAAIVAVSSVVALTACKEVPDACLSIQGSALDHPLSFASYEAAGRTYDEWRTDLTAALVNAIGLPSELPDLREPRLVERSDVDGTQVLRYQIESWVDGVWIPYTVLTPARAMQHEARHVVMLLHGHGETVDALFDEKSEMRNVGGELLDAGYVVVAMEMRSFGAFTVNGQGHNDYIAGLDDGEFVGQVVSDSIQVGEAVVNLFAEREGSTISILGHSFGGYIALHVGSVVDGLHQTMSSGLFTTYSCVNTEFHHHGQDIIAMEGIADLYDVVGMIAPAGEVELFFGEKDRLFTPVTWQAFQRLDAIFDKTGAPGKATMYLIPGIGHQVHPDTVIASLPPLP